MTVTCPTDGAVIHYTTDGREPAESDAIVASGSTVPVDHTLTLKANAWKLAWRHSDTTTAIYRIDQPPTVTISPPDGTSLLASDDLPLLVEAADADGSVTNLQLFQGTTKLAESSASPLQSTLTNLSAGTYTFTAKATDDAGLQTVSSPVTITVTASGPVVSLHGTQPIFTSSPGTLAASVLGVNPGSLTNLTLNGVSRPVTTGNFTITVPLVEGQNNFTLIATDNQNRTNQAATTVSLNSIAPTISISAPANNSTFNTTRINVRGSFTAPSAAIKRITVNGVPAFISGTAWETLNVPLVSGANTITAAAVDIAGNTNTASVTITGDSTLVDPVQVQASIVGGFAPLQVTFTPQASVPGTIQQVLYDFTGDNATFQTETNLEPVTQTYSAGQYFPVVTVVNTDGQRFSSLGGWNGGADRLRINVQAGVEIVSGSTISIADPVDLKWMPGGFLYVLSRSGASITEYDITGTNPVAIRTVTGIGSNPNGLDVDSAGNVYVAVTGDNQVKRFAPTTGSFQLDTTFNGTGLIGKADRSSGSGSGEFYAPFDVALSPDGQQIAVSDTGNNRIQLFAPSGSFASSFGQAGAALGQFSAPKGLTYDDTEHIYVSDTGNNRICLVVPPVVVGASGTTGTALGQFQGAANLSVGDRGIYVADTGNNRVQEFDPVPPAEVAPATPFGPRGALSSGLSLNGPYSVAAVGDLLEEKVYIADTGNNRVILVRVPGDDPLATWTDMVAHATTGDIPGAILDFSRLTAESYRRAYLSVGTGDLATDIGQIGTLTPVFVRNDEAEYYFEQTVDGPLLLFRVEFIRENGTWKIMEF